jgi:uncharacterized protein YbaR (Trm112 family)
LLAVLACPLCDTRPPLNQQGSILVCTQCGARFPIRKGIPALRPGDALTDDVTPDDSTDHE